MGLKINIVFLRKSGAWGSTQVPYTTLPKTLDLAFSKSPEPDEYGYTVTFDDGAVAAFPARHPVVFHLTPLSVDGKPLYQERD